MKTYLVTGGAGFIGSNIVKEILDKGDAVRVVDNFSTGRRKNIEEFLQHQNFELIQGDITDLATAKKSVKDIEVVLHQAAVPSVPRSIADPLASHHANITGTLNLLIASRDERVEKFVYASSSSVYGDNPELPKKEHFGVMPISPYALTKYAGERYAQIFYHIYGLPTICLRYFNVFGPKQNPESQYAAVIPKFMQLMFAQKQPVIFGDGNQSRDFTFVDNVVQANLRAAVSQEGAGQVFNIACGQTTSLNQLISLLQKIIGTSITPIYEHTREGDVAHSKADIKKAMEIIGYRPAIYIEEGLRRTLEWFKTHENA